MSATATAPLTDAAAVARFGQVTESFYCPVEACDAHIPHTHVASNIDRTTGVRTLRILCPSCDAMHEAKYALRNGTWTLLGAIERVNDQRRRRGMKTRIEHVTGQMQATDH